MPSKKKMRKEIDEWVDLLGQLLTRPADDQEEGLTILAELGEKAGAPQLTQSMSQMIALPPSERTQAIRALRGELLAIKRTQYSG
jgi:hypothetical protein